MTYLPVQKNGLINLDDLENAITDKTSLVSIMGVNNEIGVVQPLKEIGAICRKHGVRRRAVHPPQAARPPRAADVGRRAGARLSLGDAAHAAGGGRNARSVRCRGWARRRSCAERGWRAI